MRIHFPFLVAWLIPQTRNLSTAMLQQIIETARQHSLERIKRDGGWCLLLSLLVPFLLLGTLFLKLDLQASDYRIVLMGALVAASSLLSSLMMTLWYGLMLKPAIMRLLPAGDGAA